MTVVAEEFVAVPAHRAADVAKALEHAMREERRNGLRPPAWVLELRTELENLALQYRQGVVAACVPGLSVVTVDDGAWVSAQAAADRIGISKSAVTNRCRQGTVVARKSDRGEWELPEDQVERWRDERYLAKASATGSGGE